LDGRCRNRAVLRRLWEVCQTPDFRKTTLDEHVRLCRTVFDYLTSRTERLPEDWIAEQFAGLDRTEGDIDVLAQRLAGVRTLAYAANRPDWLHDPAHWRQKTRALEDRLSDTLHERLMARFIDRRTSALMRSLHQRADVLAGVGADGAITVEGHYVGRLKGLKFEIAPSSTALEDKALRGAAQRAVAPELTKRLGQLCADPDDRFALLPSGLITWNGEAAGRLVSGRPFAPRCELFGELGQAPARERARRRLEAFIVGEAGRVLRPLKRLDDAIADGALRGLARGIAYRLAEAGGVLPRAGVSAEVAALSQGERRALRSLGVQFGTFAVFLSALLAEDAKPMAAAFALITAPTWRPPADRPSRLPTPVPPPVALGWRGVLACGGLAIPVDMLERLGALLREAPQAAGGVALSDEALNQASWSPGDAAVALRSLGYTAARRPEAGQPTIWRRRKIKAHAKSLDDDRRVTGPPPPSLSPFAALAQITVRPAPAAPKRLSRRRRPRKPRAVAGAA
jgi:ATP-dependent RNA helicase SUPV3L1/SUV3